MKVSKISGLGRFGIIVDDVDFNNLTEEEWLHIGQLHMQNLVTIIRNTNCTKDQFVERMLAFGDTRYNMKNYMMKKYNRPWLILLNDAQKKEDYLEKDDAIALRSLFSVQEVTANGYDVSKVTGGYDAEGNPNGLFAEGELLWHSNESGTLTWTPGVALLAYKNVVGSATGFVTTTDYYETIPDSFRRELDEMILIHKFTPGKINPGLNAEQDAIMHANMCPLDNAEVPMVIQSPSGIKGLHYSINTVHSIKGLTKKESDEIFNRINKELFVEKYTYDHWYQNENDLMLFDNSITLHRRLGNIEGRLCYRIPHDYTNLQDSYYQPYLQEPYISRYAEEIRSIIKLSGIKNFKLPPTNWLNKFTSGVKRYVGN